MAKVIMMASNLGLWGEELQAPWDRVKKAGHDVTLATFVRSGDPPDAIRHLEGLVSRLVTCPISRSRRQTVAALARSLVQGEPVLIARDRVSAMLANLRRLVIENQFDAIHADQLWMAPYAL